MRADRASKVPANPIQAYVEVRWQQAGSIHHLAAPDKCTELCEHTRFDDKVYVAAPTS